jgi:hypothetical protein
LQARGQVGKEGSSFFEEKEAKRLFDFGPRQCRLSTAPGRKSFLVLFFKKEHPFFLAY